MDGVAWVAVRLAGTIDATITVPDDVLLQRVNGAVIPWRMAVVFDNLIVAVAGLFTCREQHRSAGWLHHDEVTDHVAHMRDVASRFPYGGPYRTQLEQLAAALQREILE